MKVVVLFMGLISILPVQGQSVGWRDFTLIKEQIVIKGRTNVNKFECRLDLDGVEDSLQIRVLKEKNSYDFSGLNINIPVDSFNCKHRVMTEEFRELLQSEIYPNLNLDITHIEEDIPSKVKMVMNLFVSGRTREEFINDGYAKDMGNKLLLGGSHKIYLHAYDIEPPRKLLGAVVVKDELDISFEVTLTIKKNKGEP